MASEHSCGTVVLWSNTSPVRRRGDHPLIFPADGSHANWLWPSPPEGSSVRFPSTDPGRQGDVGTQRCYTGNFFGQHNAGIEPRATNFSGLMHAPGETTTPASIAQSVRIGNSSGSWTQYQGHWGQQELVAKFGIAVPGTKEEQGGPEGLVTKNAWNKPADALSNYTRWAPPCSWSEFSFRTGECTVITNN